MKFRIKRKSPPQPGDFWQVRKFAWLPVFCEDDGVLVWLERYEAVYEWLEYPTPGWVKIESIALEKKT